MRRLRSPAYTDAVRTDEQRVAALGAPGEPDFRVWAAEDLAGSRHPWATAALVDALGAVRLGVDAGVGAVVGAGARAGAGAGAGGAGGGDGALGDHGDAVGDGAVDAEVEVAGAIVRSLALRAKGDAAARAAIVKVLRDAVDARHDALVTTACNALVEMRAADTLGALTEIFRRTDLFAGDLARAIVSLGGRAEAPLFREALRWRGPRATWAAWALGHVADRGAAPLLEEIATARLARDRASGEDADTFGGDDAPTVPDVPPGRAMAAIAALVRLGAPSAPDLVDAALRMPGATREERSAFVDALVGAEVPAISSRLAAAAGDPAATLGDPALYARLLAAALRLGHDRAGEALVAATNDATASPCARGWAALSLLDARDPRGVPYLFALLRTNAAHGSGDVRDDEEEAVALQQAALAAIEEHGASSRRSLVAVCDLLHELRTNAGGQLRAYVTSAAQSALERLTGTERPAEYKRWRARAKDQTLD